MNLNMEAIKNFDFERFQASVRNLDPERIGSWPLPFRVAVWVLIALVIVVGGYELLLSSEFDQLKVARDQEVTKKSDYEAKAFKAINLNLYRKQLADMENSFGTLLRQLPKEAEVPGLLEDITQTGLGSGLDFDSINLLPEKKKEFYAEDPINIKVKGDYHAFGSFVSGIAALPRIVTLHDFHISPVGARIPGDNSPPLLSMEILANTYRYLDSSGSGDKPGNSKGGAHP